MKGIFAFVLVGALVALAVGQEVEEKIDAGAPRGVVPDGGNQYVPVNVNGQAAAGGAAGVAGARNKRSGFYGGFGPFGFPLYGGFGGYGWGGWGFPGYGGFF